MRYFKISVIYLISVLELAEKGVRVNSVNPGVIVTNLHKRAGQNEEQYAKVQKFPKIFAIAILKDFIAF